MKVSVKIDAKDMNVVGAPAVLEMSVDSEDRTKVFVEIDDSGAVEVPTDQLIKALQQLAPSHAAAFGSIFDQMFGGSTLLYPPGVRGNPKV